MKVVTIGRSIDNDVCINDPYVGRHHCQIVQHDDGVFAIVDMNSTNGTFVNGRRIFGEAQLQPDDSVIIGHTTLPWGSYFPSKTKSYALPIVLGCVGWALLTIVLTLLFFKHGSDKAFVFKEEYPDAVAVNMVDEDGTPYTIEAIEGQVIVVFADNVSHAEALQVIREAGGQVIAQTPNTHYYLVNTHTGMESDFMQKSQTNSAIEFVYPNAVSYPCVATPYVMDNFKYVFMDRNASHGEMVSDALGQCESGGYINRREVGKDGEKYMVWSEIDHRLKEILDGATDENQPIINMSFCTALDKDGKKWIDVTDRIHKVYRLNYIKEIKHLLAIIKPYDDKEFIVVKGAGNDGVWDFEKEILNPLYNELDQKQRSMMDRHFLFVAALDGDKKYSNDLMRGTNHKWVTKVDISDYKFKNQHVPGTSIAAPRAACYLTSAAKKHNLSVTEVLQYTRKATEEAPDHILTPELLDEVITSEVTIEGVLRMYLLDNMGGGSVTYYLDKEGNAISAVGEDDSEHPYCQTIYEYRETDFDNTYLAFVVETDKRLDVTPYIESEDKDNLESLLQSAFMVVPKFQYMERKFANKYANMRVRARGTLYVPWGGWRNATPVVMDLRSIELVEREPKTVIKTTHDALTNLTGTRWRHDFSHNPEIEMYDVLQFDDESNGTALSVYQGESTVVSHFHCFYNEEYDGWCITDWGKNIMYFVINGNELNMGFYKPCVINGKNVVFDSRCYYRM